MTIPGALWIPRPPTYENDGSIFRAHVLDAADEKLAFIGRVPKTGTISKVFFHVGTVTTGATLDVRLETIDGTNGDPTGTLVAANTNGSQVVADADDNKGFLVTLTSGAVVTRNDEIAVVVVNPSASPGNLIVTSSQMFRGMYPYANHFTAAWAHQSRGCDVAFEYDDGTYEVVPSTIAADDDPDTPFSSTGSPDERALRFKLPFPVRVKGAWVHIGRSGTNSDFDIVLYDSDGSTVLASIFLDAQVRGGTQTGPYYALFTSTANLAKDTFYRLAVKPTSSGSVTLRDITVLSAAQMDAWDGGQDFHLSTRTDAGAWTETLTRRPLAGILVDQFDKG